MPSSKRYIEQFQFKVIPINENELRRRPRLCTILYRKPLQASNCGGTFVQIFPKILYAVFTKMPYTFSILSSKMSKRPSIKGGPVSIGAVQTWMNARQTYTDAFIQQKVECAPIPMAHTAAPVPQGTMATAYTLGIMLEVSEEPVALVSR